MWVRLSSLGCNSLLPDLCQHLVYNFLLLRLEYSTRLGGGQHVHVPVDRCEQRGSRGANLGCGLQESRGLVSNCAARAQASLGSHTFSSSRLSAAAVLHHACSNTCRQSAASIGGLGMCTVSWLSFLRGKWLRGAQNFGWGLLNIAQDINGKNVGGQIIARPTPAGRKSAGR